MKCIIGIFVLFLLCSGLFGQEVSFYNPILAKTFPVGKNPGELGFNKYNEPSYIGPSGLCFDLIGNLYISDNINRRIVVCDPTFQYKSTIKSVSGNIKIARDGNILVFPTHYSVVKYDREGNRLFLVNFRKTQYRYQIRGSRLIVYGNLVIAQLKDGRIISIKNPVVDSEKNNGNILDHIETVEMINQNHPVEIENQIMKTGTSQNGLRIEKYDPFQDSIKQMQSQTNERRRQKEPEFRGYLVYDGDTLLTTDFETYYYATLNNRNTMIDAKQGFLASEFDLQQVYKNPSKSNFLGKDQDGNVYWESNETYFVFNASGILLDIFRINIDSIKSVKGIVIVFKAVSPDGDLYALTYDGELNYLYKVERTW